MRQCKVYVHDVEAGILQETDDHLKNFSLMNRGNGEYHLTPAHELINRSFLPEQLKRYYWQSYNYRRTTLTSH